MMAMVIHKVGKTEVISKEEASVSYFKSFFILPSMGLWDSSSAKSSVLA